MDKKTSTYDESAFYTCFRTVCNPVLRRAVIGCVRSIFYNFFFRQYRAAFLPGRSPVSSVDHPLDAKIPFTPSWVTIYLDFVTFWVRMLAFLLRAFKRGAFAAVSEFITSMGNLYAFAAQVYQKNFSTTERPFYIARPRFFLIHLVDPHLMCIPSLHVMVAIRTYTKFAEIIRSLGKVEIAASQMEELKKGALAITEAVLYVKQHSINCISAALYAMTCFDGKLFPPEEAEAFTALLFTGQKSAPPGSPFVKPPTRIPPADAEEIRNYIINLYRQFLSEGEKAETWDKPLLNFLRSQPRKL
jgi:hypothetical protein